MTKVQQIKLLIEGASGQLASAPGHPSLWKAVEKSCGKISFLRSQALHVEWNQDIAESPLPDLEQWRKWLCFRGIHNIELSENVKRVTLQVRRCGVSPDAITTLTQDMLALRRVKGVQRLWLARQTEFLFEGEVSPKSENLLMNALGHVLELREKSGLYNPEFEEVRILSPKDSLHWASAHSPRIESVRELKDQLHSFLSEGSWSPLKRTYRILQKNEWSRTPISETVRNPARQLSRVFESPQGESLPEASSYSRGAPVDMVVSLAKNPDTYSNLDKLRVRCESFASLLDRPLGQILFRESSSGAPLFDSWSSLGSLQKITSEKVKDDEVLCLLGAWDRRNPVAERRVDSFLHKLSHVLERPLIGQKEIVYGNQDWVACFFELLTRHSSGWRIFFHNISTLLGRNSVRTSMDTLVFGWVHEKDIPRIKQEAVQHRVDFLPLAGFDLQDKIQLIDAHEAVVGEMALTDLFGNNPLRDEPVDVTWVVPEERAPLYGFDRVALFPDEYMLRVSFREKIEIDWIKELRRHSSGDGYRSLLMRNAGNQPINGYRWTDGARQWAFAVGKNEGRGAVNPQAASRYAVDAAVRTLISLGGSPQVATAEILISIPSSIQDASKDFLAAMALHVEGLAESCEKLKIPLGSVREIIAQSGVSYPEVYVRLISPLNDFFPPPFPGFRMAGEHLYIVGIKPTFMDCGSRLLEHLSRVESNHISEIDPVVYGELYSLVLDLQNRGWVTSLRPVFEGGVAAALAEMTLWSRMGAQIRPGLNPIELFSAAPGRFVMGVLPAEVSRFESLVKSEWMVPLGITGGEKVLGLTLERLQSARTGQRVL